jgi:hypothetical protein
MADRPGQWRRSSRCESHNCVEVALAPDGVRIRDSASPDGPGITIGNAAWRAFCAGLKARPVRR